MDHPAVNNRTVAAWDGAILGSDATSVSYVVPPDHPAFEGHFPGSPVLPGIVQIRLFLLTAQRLTGKAWQLGEVQRAKFMRPVLPGQKVVVKMRAKPDDVFEFTLHAVGGEPHAQAQLQLIPQ